MSHRTLGLQSTLNRSLTNSSGLIVCQKARNQNTTTCSELLPDRKSMLQCLSIKLKISDQHIIISPCEYAFINTR